MPAKIGRVPNSGAIVVALAKSNDQAKPIWLSRRQGAPGAIARRSGGDREQLCRMRSPQHGRRDQNRGAAWEAGENP
jgi:hypothetical protein